CIKVLSCLCQEDTEGEIKREQTQEQRTEKDSMYELSAKNDRLIWNGGRNREEEILANCYFNSMKLAMDNGIRSIAFPSISTGVYSFPVELAAKIAVHAVNRFLQDNPDSFDLVEWVLFDTNAESVYEAEVDQLYKMI
ncbi:MAG: macro domain-containing protein, partial [Lachnospiraceae bacterium]|nr:macro domain-containing protein [Lachnospiraceae bacterium]